MAFELPQLPYAIDALEPVIRKQTVEFHYTKHHQGYVNNLNKLTAGTAFENATLEEIIMKADGGIFNNGAQVYNHTFYWEGLSPQGGNEPTGKLADAINKAYGSFDAFKDQFTVKATTLFGSGWAWLVMKSDGSLDIVQTGNAANPLRDGLKPLFTVDVWEHAYYLDYQNRRPDYVASIWKLVDWNKVAERMG